VTENSEIKDIENTNDLIFHIENFIENYDSTKFTKSDRMKIFDNTRKSFESRKQREIKKIDDLQKRAERGDKKAEKELHIKKTISEVAKPLKPKSMDEHIKIINSNIEKIFTNPDFKNQKKEINSLIPTKYELYQNYPNPFNPVTKISFDLPKDAKIKLIVYDILGREVTRLLNSEFKQAGKHIIDFDAMKYNLASGVYFYRIESGDFNAVKKMILIK